MPLETASQQKITLYVDLDETLFTLATEENYHRLSTNENLTFLNLEAGSYKLNLFAIKLNAHRILFNRLLEMQKKGHAVEFVFLTYGTYNRDIIRILEKMYSLKVNELEHCRLINWNDCIAEQQRGRSPSKGSMINKDQSSANSPVIDPKNTTGTLSIPSPISTQSAPSLENDAPATVKTILVDDQTANCDSARRNGHIAIQPPPFEGDADDIEYVREILRLVGYKETPRNNRANRCCLIM